MITPRRFFQPGPWSLAIALALPAVTVRAEVVQEIAIRAHKFEPAELHLPANTKVKLQIRNLDPSAEEFESYELKREKLIPGGATVSVFVGPLKPGEYPFFGEFNPATAQGRIIVE